MGDKKITGSPRSSLEEHWGRLAAKKFFDGKKIVQAIHFDTIWWEGYDRAMAGYPKTYRTFVTKQVSGFCGSNSKLSLWEEGVESKCPQCGHKHENSKHLTRCTDPGRLTQLHQSIGEVMDVLSEANVDEILSDMVEKYLLAQGRLTMKECTPSDSRYKHVASAIDNLGWDCFLEGRIPRLLIETIHPMLRRYKPRCSINIWGAKFIKSLITITHKQWLYRNNDVHHVIDGLSSRQQQELAERIRELMKVRKNTLLGRHKHFMDVDFNKLGSGTTIARQVWVANVEMAISVAKIARGNFCTQDSLRILCTPVTKTPVSMRTRYTPLLTPIVLTRMPATGKTGAIKPQKTARSLRLSKSLYAPTCANQSNASSSKQISMLPVRIRQTRETINKNRRQLFLTASPPIKLRPYDKIVAHLQRLHTKRKAKEAGIKVS
jgi:hypothetical protein